MMFFNATGRIPPMPYILLDMSNKFQPTELSIHVYNCDELKEYLKL